MKVTEIKYQRRTVEQAQEGYNKVYDKLDNAKSVQDCLEALKMEEEVIKYFSTMSTLAQIRISLNTKDEFYQQEAEYYANATPLLTQCAATLYAKILKHPLRAELEKVLNPQLFKFYECQQLAFSPAIIEDMQEENKICLEYDQLMGGLLVDYNGEKLPMSVVRGNLEKEDRQVRKDSMNAMGRALSSVSSQLDDIYDRLVKVRDKMAKKMGYENFIPLGYYRMGRMDYDAAMVDKYRRNVLKDIVPLVNSIKHNIATQLHIDDMKLYDDGIYTVGGNARPCIDKEEMFARASKMYHQMQGEVGDLFDSMVENDAFDVVAREGKVGGGYCTFLADYNQPFIFANFNGSSGDFDVITHEFGHALSMYYCGLLGDYTLNIGNMETAECHSMSMEFFSSKYAQSFFGKDTDKFLFKQLCDSVCFIPYGVIVDEYQHIVYANPELTPQQRCDEWLKLEAKYRPYLSYNGIDYIERGTRWQYQAHIYQSPFYYIDYCLAQTVALGFFVAMKQDYDDAFNRYIELVKTGGQKGFPQLIKDANIAYPFGDGTLSIIAKEVESALEKLKV